MTAFLVSYSLVWVALLIWTFTPYGTDYLADAGEPLNWLSLVGGVLAAVWMLDLTAHLLSLREMMIGSPWGRAVRLVVVCLGAAVGWRTQPFSILLGGGILVLVVGGRIVIAVVEYIWTGENTLPSLMEFFKSLKG
jgi:hypothetical protein